MPSPPVSPTAQGAAPLPSAPATSPPVTQTRTSRWRQALTNREPVEYTPANSIYEQNVGGLTTLASNMRTFQRFINGLLHLVVASILLAIMMEYVVASEPKSQESLVNRDVVLIDVNPGTRNPVPLSYQDGRCRSLAIVTIVFSSTDILIDFIHTFLISLPWTTFALLPRLLLGIGYLAVFMVHVGLQKVFPPGYSYWGLNTEYAGPVVYLFLWAMGVWDMVHVCIHRYRLGKDSRRWRDQYKQWRSSDNPEYMLSPTTSGPTAAGARDGAMSGEVMSQVAQVDLEVVRDAHDPNSISLQEREGQHGGENKSIGVTSTLTETPPSTADTETRPPDDEVRGI